VKQTAAPEHKTCDTCAQLILRHGRKNRDTGRCLLSGKIVCSSMRACAYYEEPDIDHVIREK